MSEHSARETLFDAIEEVGDRLQTRNERPEDTAGILRDLAEAWAWLSNPSDTGGVLRAPSTRG
jgi:hypothetical protein